MHLPAWREDASPPWREALEAVYTLHIKEPWESFCRRATDSPDLYLVKTHDLPYEDQPAIHTVRDGRSAVFRHWRFRRSIGAIDSDLIASVDGALAFAAWSRLIGHWRSARPRSMLKLSYESLVHGDGALLRGIADFVGHRGAVRAWRDAIATIAAVEPDFFSRRMPVWKRPPEWTDAIEVEFERRHGWMMDEFCYFGDRLGRRLRYAAKSAVRRFGFRTRGIYVPAPSAGQSP